MNKYLVICGATASGKTDYAHNIAKKLDGEIVNADSMQLYKDVPIMTATPSEIYRAEIPYHLYNCINIDEQSSVIQYAKHASKVILNILDRGKLPIIVGGSGMYINSLIYGYHEIPDISTEIRDNIKLIHDKIGAERFFKNLCSIDPMAKYKLNPNDTQRVVRAYSVMQETGRSIFEFYLDQKVNLLKNVASDITLLMPDRTFLYQMCKQRFTSMLERGVVDEIKSLLETYDLEIIYQTKIIGIQEILDFIQNKISLDEAALLGITKTRRYAKRQLTWFKHQILADNIYTFSNLLEFEKLL